MAAVVLLNNATSNGAGLTLDCVGKKKALFLVEGDFDAEIALEATIDGTKYFSYGGYLGVNDIEVTRVKAPGYVKFNAEFVVGIRPVVVNYKYGTITVTGYAE